MHDQYCILYDHLFQELQSLKEENSKLRNMRSDMDDELHQLTENLFEVCVCVCACVAVNCESESTWRVILLLPSALSSHFPPSLLPPPPTLLGSLQDGGRGKGRENGGREKTCRCCRKGQRNYVYNITHLVPNRKQ